MSNVESGRREAKWMGNGEREGGEVDRACMVHGVCVCVLWMKKQRLPD